MSTVLQPVRRGRGIALFDQGFRPLFLGAGLFAAIAIPAWVAAHAAGAAWPTHLAARDWHAHEMIFGYFAAVLGGFVLTAIPNWTGRLPVSGGPLATLAALWLAGRIAMATSDGWPLAAAAVDSAYLVVLAAIAGREAVAGRTPKNLPVCALIALVAGANIGFHAAVLVDGDARLFERAALAVAAMLMALIGGRIVPSFTRNWLARRGPAAMPAPFGAVDRLALATVAAALVSWVALPDSRDTGALFAVAAALHAIRVARWRFWTTAAEPLLAILHVGAFWLAAWFALEAAAILAPGALDVATARHALTAGAIGTMTLAVMTRAIRGHTGRALAAGGGTAAIYALVNAGAILRLAAPLLPADPALTLGVSGLLWAAGFALFVVLYAPMVLTPRAR